MLRPFAPTADDVRLLYLAAALAPDLRRTWVDKKGKAHPYATIVARDYLKVRPLHMGKPGSTPRLTRCSSSCRGRLQMSTKDIASIATIHEAALQWQALPADPEQTSRRTLGKEQPKKRQVMGQREKAAK